MNSKLFSEIIQDFEKANTKAERIETLRKNFSPRFADFLRIAFDKNIVFDVEVLPYRPSVEPAGLNYMYLQNELSKLYRFIANHPNRPATLTPKKQSTLLIQVLESLHKDEADLLVRVIKKEFKVPYLTAKLINEAYPGINLAE